MKKRLLRYNLSVERSLVDFIENSALPGTGISEDNFWHGLSSLVERLSSENRELLTKREELQSKIDSWHKARRNMPHDHEAYKSYLKEIGYLVEERENFLLKQKMLILKYQR